MNKKKQGRKRDYMNRKRKKNKKEGRKRGYMDRKKKKNRKEAWSYEQ